MNLVDPDGKNPIYDQYGNFMGVDDKGLQGNYIVMNNEHFVNGMSHENAMSISINASISKAVALNINQHFSTLSGRPDYDGIVTISEGIEWAKSHPNALEEPTADNTLYIDTSKLNFGSLKTSDFKTEGEPTLVNLFNVSNAFKSIFQSDVRNNVYALGKVSMTLIDNDAKTVRVNNGPGTVYDWDKGGNKLRKSLITINNTLSGINPTTHGFNAFYYGTGTLRK